MHNRNYKFKVNPTISLFTKASSCLLSRSTPSEQPGVKQEKLLVPQITKAFQYPFKLLYKVLNLIPGNAFAIISPIMLRGMSCCGSSAEL